MKYLIALLLTISTAYAQTGNPFHYDPYEGTPNHGSWSQLRGPASDQPTNPLQRDYGLANNPYRTTEKQCKVYVDYYGNIQKICQ